MGCCSSSPRKVGEISNVSVQDEARSFRSKVDAMKFMTKNIHSRYAFRLFLEKAGGVEYLMCYTDLEEIKMQNDENMVPIALSTIGKYQAIIDELSRSGAQQQQQQQQQQQGDHRHGSVKAIANAKIDIEMIIWEKLRRLRQIDMKNTTRKEMVSAINTVQGQLLAELANPFEDFLKSPQYKEWNQHQVKAEGVRHKTETANGSAIPVDHRVGSGKTRHAKGQDAGGVRPFSPLPSDGKDAPTNMQEKLAYPVPAVLKLQKEQAELRAGDASSSPTEQQGEQQGEGVAHGSDQESAEEGGKEEAYKAGSPSAQEVNISAAEPVNAA